MKINLNKPAFAAPHSLCNDGSMNALPQEGMTVREELWARFAANPPTMPSALMFEQHPTEKYVLIRKGLADWAIEYADAMLATIEARNND